MVAQRAQRLDETGERLRRGLADRAAQARERLIAQGGKLSVPLLRANVRHAREKLASLERVMRSLDPDSVLQRGYARVTDAAGRTVVTAAEAGKEPTLNLLFRDGALGVVPGTAAKKRPAAAAPAGSQPKLL
jgi:exodeoxyribonuclease VII large subunit